MTLPHSAGSPAEPVPLSPILLAGMALGRFSPAVLNPLLDAALSQMRRRHPQMFERLKALGSAGIQIEPVDLPVVFLFRPGAKLAGLRAYRPEDAPSGATARIRGPYGLLIALLEGRLDGDAAFFSRALVIEGDTGVIMALRYAVDSGGIDIVEDLSRALGPFAPWLRRPAELLRSAYRHADRDLQMFAAALRTPFSLAMRQQDVVLRGLAHRLEEQGAKINRLESRARRPAAGPELAP